MYKKGMSWIMILLIIAIITLIVLFPTTAQAGKLWKTIKDKIKFGDDNTELKTIQDLPPDTNPLNIALRTDNKSTDRTLETAQLEQLFSTMEIADTITVGTSKVYLLKSTVDKLPVYTVYSPKMYGESLMLFTKNIELDDGYDYTYGQAVYTGDAEDEGMGIDEGPFQLEWDMPWNPFNRDISTTMNRHCRGTVCMPDTLNQAIARLKLE